jgi:3-carboxy-cis,cis-muconate cycloisomerase
MPHKRNPSGCTAVIAGARMAQGLVPVVLQSMMQEHERGLGGWAAEWGSLPQLVALTAGCVASVADILEGLQIDTTAMRRNLVSRGGLAFSEGVLVALVPTLGRESAHRIVEAAAADATAAGRSLKDMLAANAKVRRALAPEDLARLFDPAQSIGAADVFADRALAEWRRLD